MLWRQVRPRLLWDVRQFAQVTNSRTIAGHTFGANPVPVPEGVTAAIFHFHLVFIERNLTALRVFGSLAATGFPSPGLGVAEGLSVLTVGGNQGGTGKLRQPQPPTVNATRRWGGQFSFPSFLLCEYSTSGIFVGAGECHFSVWVTWLGPPIVGVS